MTTGMTFGTDTPVFQ